MKINNSGYFTLVGLIIVIAIIAIIAATQFGGKDTNGDKKTLAGQSIDRAKDVECQSNLKQAKMAVESYKVENNDTLPSSISDLAKYGFTMNKCPVSGESYVYDATTGKVSCPTKGHENF